MKMKSESEVAQSCPTLSNTMDCSLPVSSIHGIFQARVLEWGVITFSMLGTQLCPILWTPWMVAHQAPLSMELSRQEYWSGSLFHFTRDLPDPGIKSGSFALKADSLLSELPGKSNICITYKLFHI